MYVHEMNVVDMSPPVELALPSSDAVCPSWQWQSSLLAAVASTDTWHTNESSDTCPFHPVVFVDDTLGTLDCNAAMQHAVLEHPVTKTAMPATKLPEATIPSPDVETIPQHSNLVCVDMVNMSAIALPFLPELHQTYGTDYAIGRFQLREKQLLINLQQSPMAAERSAFLTLDSIAAFSSKCLTSYTALPKSAQNQCGFVLRYGQSCSAFSVYFATAPLQPQFP